MFNFNCSHEYNNECFSVGDILREQKALSITDNVLNAMSEAGFDIQNITAFKEHNWRVSDLTGPVSENPELVFTSDWYSAYFDRNGITKYYSEVPEGTISNMDDAKKSADYDKVQEADAHETDNTNETTDMNNIDERINETPAYKADNTALPAYKSDDTVLGGRIAQRAAQSVNERSEIAKNVRRHEFDGAGTGDRTDSVMEELGLDSSLDVSGASIDNESYTAN
jgi:hypothetical protein